MSKELKFYQGGNGKNIIEVVYEEEKGQYSCCGEPMNELIANTSDGAAEKHVPVVKCSGSEVTVEVGSVYHPMTEEHSIAWVCLETKKGTQRVCLSAQEPPVAKFVVADGDQPVAAYAYCNLHGFWKTQI